MPPRKSEELLQPISQKPGDNKYYQGIEQGKQKVARRTAGDKSIFAEQMDELAVEMLAKEFKISKKKISAAVQNTVIYTHGLACMMMWDNYRLPKEKACRMLFDVGVTMLKDIGVESRKTWKDFAALL